MKNKYPVAAVFVVVAWGITGVTLGVNQTPGVKDDPLVRMPGTQPAPEGNVSLESPGRCLNCHAGYNPAVEPGHNWKGSMMAQSARDFLFWSCMTVAGQDSAWAIGTPNAVDICQRCHFPKGWLEGRSDPPNASAMAGADYDGVQCDFCHRMYDPFFETTHAGQREGNDWLGFWDETNASGTPSQPAADNAHAADATQAQGVLLFRGDPFFQNNVPFSPEYTEATSGQYYVSADGAKRASFADAAARHQMLYSRFHKSKYMCATCHDVSNPVLANLGQDGTAPLTTETVAAHGYFHVERTFSEFQLSAYGRQGGAPGEGPFAPDVFETSQPNNHINKCQDCHMRDVVGVGCNKRGVPIRPNDSTEHPRSGQPLHDLTGGNAWVSAVLASAVPGSPNYDPFNDQQLNQGPAALTLDLTQGEGLDPQALLDGALRAREQLQLAAEIEEASYSAATGALSFRVQNQTGHKLISGFPEGRRMFVNIRAYSEGALIYEVNPYDAAASTLKGLSYSYQPDPNGTLQPPVALDPASEAYVDELVYEMHPSSTLTGETETFHFALSDDRYKDNRIPPKGFRIAEAASRISVPRWHGADAPGYFTSDEYAGGYDDVSLTIAGGADFVEINLYYQTTSREYIEFLRDEINGDPANRTLPANAYIVQTDAFFGGMKAWGDTIWNLWSHNRDLDGAAPFLMAQATVGAAPEPCGAPVPTLSSAAPANGEVTLAWNDLHSGDPGVVGYSVYYDQAGKSQFITDAGLSTTHIDSGLSNGVEYCYKVSSAYVDCESDFSNLLCAIPNAGGQLDVSVAQLETGRWVTTGKGKNKITIFELTDLFQRGDAAIVRAHVIDVATGLPLANATVEIVIDGPDTTTLTMAPSDNDGLASATWQTESPNRKGQGGTTPGTYTVTVTDVSATGYVWDGTAASTSFALD